MRCCPQYRYRYYPVRCSQNKYRYHEFNFADNILERGAGPLPPEIFRCPNVKSLSLKNNFLEVLSPEVGRLGRLERLVLTHNLLKNQSIPFTLCFCRYWYRYEYRGYRYCTGIRGKAVLRYGRLPGSRSGSMG